MAGIKTVPIGRFNRIGALLFTFLISRVLRLVAVNRNTSNCINLELKEKIIEFRDVPTVRLEDGIFDFDITIVGNTRRNFAFRSGIQQSLLIWRIFPLPTFQRVPSTMMSLLQRIDRQMYEGLEQWLHS